ncbi:amino acid biosynthesis protein [Xylocopilactobacillus apicola]|uniref:Amino acid biosynthesis protein n=1 Tax=Xylocopilactobacillus apicola TaxID=2932184 RepID=A0AAU9DYD7_9LACO|nr:amino acid biosynthesis protein [Xylocopilactobacillus apicola]BDR59193.1 amino acid biosynthesis protein [Xylocopilactobacillus apicola]
MNIHTLGPCDTDSYAAAADYNARYQNNLAQIICHESFEEILANLADFSKEYLIIPTAFKSNSLHASWGDIHYTLLDQMNLLTSFITKLDPLVVVKRLNAANKIGYTHAATAELLKNTIKDVSVITTPSKYLAYQAYQENQAAYVLTNTKNIKLTTHETVIKSFSPSMVWCLYQIN